MKLLFSILFLFLATFTFAQTKILSWNIANFGKSKSEETITYIAKTLKDYDIIAIQEVVAGYGGAQAVARLADELNRKGAKWEYVISDPTSSSAYKTERYAFIWKSSKVKKIGKAWLEKKYQLEIEREPYFCTFQYKNKQFTLVNFHAITKKMQPESEIKYFKFLPDEYPTLNLIFAGDFNCPQSHSVFNSLKKMGFQSILVNQKTSLKQECKKEICLASEFDNMYYKTSKTTLLNSGIIPFYKNFSTLKEARKISDHVPIWFEFSLN
ncbi:endonuclease [Flavobacterium sp. RSP49]|uniref:endonuclease/exonuclease/phosphatase family protein n=1 Tax=unclassified Flavobacterium TaxID=196869 RepID=UPI000F81B172|nr:MULTISPECIES: endonuclease/exonuclease/phosphatase family protein [unclassified Flavobacterium]RTY87140.1 endonuclease [Flavobacterium sp. RSP15]RTZ00405.1 endonuclease [Flavobacterium sp. RSP49]